jgi:hypothetical protein
MEKHIENSVRIILIVFAIALFTIAGYLYVQKATEASAMAFVFLVVCLLTIANYKRIKGFGFEAEMWEEEQVQAAKLIDRLELLSKASAQQVSLIAAKMGLWDSGLSNPQMADLIDTTRRILQDTGTTEAERKNILAPLYQRVTLNYVGAAIRLVDQELRNDHAAFEVERKTGITDALRERMRMADEATKRLREIKTVEMAERKHSALGSPGKRRPSLRRKSRLVSKIGRNQNGHRLL